MMRQTFSVVACVGLLSFTGNTTCAALITVDISSVVNANYDSDYLIRNEGSNPAPDSPLGGIDFALPGSGLNYHRFINNTSFTMPLSVPVSNVVAAYLLLNTDWGEQDYNAGSVTFSSASHDLEVDLIGGVNIRDWSNGRFVNSTTDPNVAQNVYSVALDMWGKAGRMDMLKVDLQSFFAGDTLTSFSIRDTGEIDRSRIRFAGITFEVVPEPTTLAIWSLFGGLGMIAARRRRRTA